MRSPALLIPLLFALPSAATAQASLPDTLRLSLGDALARVRAEHPVVRAGVATVRAAEARAAELRRYANPTLEVERATASEVDNIALLQPIRWPWESAALSGLGRAEVVAAAAGAEQERRAVVLDVAQRFLDALRDARALALAAEAESLAARALQRMQAARELGQAGDLSVLQTQVSLDAARRARVGIEAELRASSAGLALALGIEPATPILLAGDLAALLPLRPTDSVLVPADTTDPESVRLTAEADRAAQEARLARARRWPELALGPAASLGSGSTVGVSFGIGFPLWNRQGAAIRAAAADRETALARLEVRRRELGALVRDAANTLARSDRELVMLRSGELARAEQAQALAARALQQGGPYLAAWLSARQAHLDARRAELDLEWQAARARLVLRHLAGSLTTQGAP